MTNLTLLLVQPFVLHCWTSWSCQITVRLVEFYVTLIHKIKEARCKSIQPSTTITILCKPYPENICVTGPCFVFKTNSQWVCMCFRNPRYVRSLPKPAFKAQPSRNGHQACVLKNIAHCGRITNIILFRYSWLVH